MHIFCKGRFLVTNLANLWKDRFILTCISIFLSFILLSYLLWSFGERYLDCNIFTSVWGSYRFLFFFIILSHQVCTRFRFTCLQLSFFIPKNNYFCHSETGKSSVITCNWFILTSWTLFYCSQLIGLRQYLTWNFRTQNIEWIYLNGLKP